MSSSKRILCCSYGQRHPIMAAREAGPYRQSKWKAQHEIHITCKSGVGITASRWMGGNGEVTFTEKCNCCRPLAACSLRLASCVCLVVLRQARSQNEVRSQKSVKNNV